MMKNWLSLLGILFIANLSAQEINQKEVKTKVKAATVFLDKAQIHRNTVVNLPKGKTWVKFTYLSPFIDEKSIQVKSGGRIMILSVKRQLNYDNKTKRLDQIKGLLVKRKALKDKIVLEQTQLKVIDEKLGFLRDNRIISGKNDALKFTDLQQINQFYGKNIQSLMLEKVKRNNKLKDLQQQKDTLQKKIRNIADENEYPTGEIWVKVDAKKAGNFTFDLSYVVAGAGWYPSYDVRAVDNSKPLQITYVANVKQNTQVDWHNIQLTFSTADPNISATVPKLEPYFLYYNSRPKKNFTTGNNTVYGTVIGADDGDPLPGVNVMIKGTSIGTATDFDGKYSITVPKTGGQLEFSYIGYKTVERPIISNEINVALNSGGQLLETITISAAGVEDEENEDADGGVAFNYNKKRLEKKVRGVSIKKEVKSIEIPVEQIENQTHVSFAIHTAYTVKSNNSVVSIPMKEHSIPAEYHYIAVPKMEQKAYWMAEIPDWESYSFLAAEASIFIDGTFIGKNLLDPRYAKDKLQISLGQDANVSIEREVIKDYTTRQFIGNKKEENRGWEIRVKNNKNKKIKMVVYEQIPISKLEEITVKPEEISGGKYDEKTGEVKWEFTLKPGKEKTFVLKYKVKYPKYRNLILE